MPIWAVVEQAAIVMPDCSELVTTFSRQSCPLQRTATRGTSMVSFLDDREPDQTSCRVHANTELRYSGRRNPRFVAPGGLRNLRVIPSLILCAALLFTGLCCDSNALAQGATEKVWPTRAWQTSSPEDQGMDSADLARLVAFGTTRSFDSLLIARHGKI